MCSTCLLTCATCMSLGTRATCIYIYIYIYIWRLLVCLVSAGPQPQPQPQPRANSHGHFGFDWCQDLVAASCPEAAPLGERLGRTRCRHPGTRHLKINWVCRILLRLVRQDLYFRSGCFVREGYTFLAKVSVSRAREARCAKTCHGSKYEVRKNVISRARDASFFTLSILA